MQDKRWNIQIRGKEGYVIVVSLVITTAVLILLGTFWGSIVAEKRNVEISHRSNQALNLAEAGIEKAIWDLNNRKVDSNPWTTNDTVEISGEPASFEVTVTLSATRATIVATGYVAGISVSSKIERTVRVEAEAGETPFNSALFAGTQDGNGITIIGSDIAIDSYDSEGSGKPYDPASASSNGDIATNSTSTDNPAIYVIGTGAISGGAVVGPGVNPNSAVVEIPAGIIKGEKTNAEKIRNLPPVAAPSPLPPEDRGSIGSSLFPYVGDVTLYNGKYNVINVINGNLTVDPAAEFIYVDKDFKFTQGNLIVNSDTTIYVNGDFRMLGNTSIIINGDHKHKLTLYVGGNVFIGQVGKSSTINTSSKNPLNFSLYGLSSCKSITFANLTFSNEPGFYGTVYAPDAAVSAFGSVNMCGSLVGDKMYLVGVIKIHYDKALKNPILNPSAPLIKDFKFVSGSWEEIKKE